MVINIRLTELPIAISLALIFGCNASPGPATIAAKPAAAKVPLQEHPVRPAVQGRQDEKEMPSKLMTKVATTAPAKPVREKFATSSAKAPITDAPQLVALVVQPPPPAKKEPKWKPTIAPQPPRPTFAPPGTKFDFVAGPIGELLKAQLGEGSPAKLDPPRGRPAPQRDGPSPAVLAAEKIALSLPASAYAYEGALKPVERSALPPSHPARDLPLLALASEPLPASQPVMPLLPLATGTIPPVPSALIATRLLDSKPTPPTDPTREPAFAATIKIAGTDVIGPASFQKLTLPNPFERSDEIRLRTEPADTEVPGLLSARIVERAVMPVEMPLPPAK